MRYTFLLEKWKSGRRVRDSHRAQIGVYFLQVEEELRIRPSRGVIVLGDGTRHRIENTERLRQWVLEMAVAIRSARSAVDQPIPIFAKPGQCRACGMRGDCNQARY